MQLTTHEIGLQQFLILWIAMIIEPVPYICTLNEKVFKLLPYALAKYWIST